MNNALRIAWWSVFPQLFVVFFAIIYDLFFNEKMATFVIPLGILLCSFGCSFAALMKYEEELNDKINLMKDWDNK
jgi:hypothetical protein